MPDGTPTWVIARFGTFQGQNERNLDRTLGDVRVRGFYF
jgi:hypothetical protein